ncbi:MAG: hypothetical protein ABI629_06160 [bacterium]
MTAEELRAFVEETRAEVDAELAKFDGLEWDDIAPDVRVALEEAQRGWLQLREMLRDEVVDAHVEAVMYAGRDLTDDELMALFRVQ